MRRRRAFPLFAVAPLLGLACGLSSPTAGTTRMCPALADEDEAMCYQQCADVEALSCTGLDKDGEEIHECAKDGATATYIVEEDEYVVPAGESRCFVLLADADEDSDDPNDQLPDHCADQGAVLAVLIVDENGEPIDDEDECFDINCTLVDNPKEECPDLPGN